MEHGCPEAWGRIYNGGVMMLLSIHTADLILACDVRRTAREGPCQPAHKAEPRPG